MEELLMRILIYKRKHAGDPDPKRGIFGEGSDDNQVTDCMGKVRGYGFDAVIGVGGTGQEPRVKGIACKLTWVGIGAHKWPRNDLRGPLVGFDHFWCRDKAGPYLKHIAPNLAQFILDPEKNRRHFIHNLHELPERWPGADQEIIKILTLAAKEGPSSANDEIEMRRVAQLSRSIGRNGCGGPTISPSARIHPVSRDLGARRRSC
jgi:hypothetical protein